MATTDLSALTPGDAGLAHARAALPATAGKARKIRLPRWARRVLVRVFASDGTTPAAGACGTQGADGVDEADQAEGAMPLQASESYELEVRLPGHVYVSGPANGWAHLAIGGR